MSSSILSSIDVIFQVPAASIVIFAGYRSFRLREGLVNAIYRSRALWVGVMALVISLGEVQQILSDLGYAPFYFPPYPNLAIFVIYTAFSLLAVVALFRWIDITAGVALEVDFFHRDPLHWKAIRKPAWVVVIFGIFATQFSPNYLYYSIFGAICFSPIVYAGLVILASERRVYDDALKRYMRWIGITILSLIVLGVTDTINPFLNFPLLLTAYCFYRVSVSLSSTSKVEARPSRTLGTIS